MKLQTFNYGLLIQGVLWVNSINLFDDKLR